MDCVVNTYRVQFGRSAGNHLGEAEALPRDQSRQSAARVPEAMKKSETGYGLNTKIRMGGGVDVVESRERERERERDRTGIDQVTTLS